MVVPSSVASCYRTQLCLGSLKLFHHGVDPLNHCTGQLLCLSYLSAYSVAIATDIAGSSSELQWVRVLHLLH